MELNKSDAEFIDYTYVRPEEAGFYLPDYSNELNEWISIDVKNPPNEFSPKLIKIIGDLFAKNSIKAIAKQFDISESRVRKLLQLVLGDKYDVISARNMIKMYGVDNAAAFNQFLNNPVNNLEFSSTTLPNTNQINTLARLVDKHKDRFFMTLAFNDKYWTINPNIIQSFRDLAGKSFVYPSSDFDINYFLQERRYTFRWRERVKRDIDGGFFPYTHNFKGLDLTSLQIFENNSQIKDNCDPCIINCLRHFNIDERLITSVMCAIGSYKIPRNQLQTICNICNINIKLHDMEVTKVFNIKSTHEEASDIDICFYKNHYFPLCKMNITGYALANYYTLLAKHKKIEKFNEYVSDKQKNKRNFINSMTLVKTLVNTPGALTPINLLNMNDKMPQEFIPNIDFSNLEIPVQEIFLSSKNKDIKYDDVIYFDFETCISSKKHSPYMVCCYSKTRNEFKTFKIDAVEYDNEYINYFLKFCSKSGEYKKVLLYAHNARYDAQFLINHFKRYLTYIKTGSMLKELKAMAFFGKYPTIFTIRDTFAFIPMKLSAFTSMFGLTAAKEIMPYEIYTPINIQNQYIKMSEVLKHIPIEDRIEFIIKARPYIVDTELDILGYAEFYCKQDIILLSQGFEKFREWFLPLGVDLYNFVSLPSVANQICIKAGILNGCSILKGKPQLYIQSNHVVGGRVMCAQNTKHHVTSPLVDFDATSLYPTAMRRLGKEYGGYPLGTFKVWNPNIPLESVDSFFGFIKILSTNGKQYDMPILSEKINGKRMFTNDIVGKTFPVNIFDIIQLELFYDATYEVLSGYYTNEGRSNLNAKPLNTIPDSYDPSSDLLSTIENLCNFLKNKRDEKKKIGCKSEVIYKFIANSSYGKFIQKNIKTEIKLVENEEALISFISRNLHRIKSYKRIHNGKGYIIKLQKPVTQHKNFCYIGSEILSMSKLIMNEVTCLANDIGIKIYYTDTDSMFFEKAHIPALSAAFSQKYKRILIGKHFGGFETDFDGASINSLFISKKVYYCKLDNNKEHFRLKGIPSACIVKTANENFNGSIFNLYKHLYDGGSIEFDLKNFCKFKTNDDFSTENNTSFTRVIKF